MTKKNKGKPLKEIVFSTRNKATVLYSKLFGSEQTNKILDKTFSNNMVISKLLEAEKHGFDVSYGQDEKEEADHPRLCRRVHHAEWQEDQYPG